MIFVFYFFAAVLILLSFRSFRGGIEYLRFFRADLAKPRSNYTPFASVIAPCRGLDPGLEENLIALTEQDYPAYEIIFVVDSETDPAAAVINGIFDRRDAETLRIVSGSPVGSGASNLTASQCFGIENKVSAKLVVARMALGCSQKVENLREAVLHVSDEAKAFVFVDSDVRTGREWLRSLAAPLEDEKAGAATGYRWFVSENPGFSSEMRSVWNASIASALGPNTGTNFCWGGSMAIRRDTFERLGIREKWRGTLSDDFAATSVLRSAGMPIHFVPRALAVSIEDCSLRELFEFTTRQMKITRVYATNLWLLSFFGSGLFNAVMIAASSIAVFSRHNDLSVAISIVTLLLVSIFSIGKSWLRLEAVRLVLTGNNTRLQRQYLTQLTFWILTPALFFINSFSAWISRRMIWRGTGYELKSSTETVIITDRQPK